MPSPTWSALLIGRPVRPTRGDQPLVPRARRRPGWRPGQPPPVGGRAGRRMGESTGRRTYKVVVEGRRGRVAVDEGAAENANPSMTAPASRTLRRRRRRREPGHGDAIDSRSLGRPR
jgi:hypothetical protein